MIKPASSKSSTWFQSTCPRGARPVSWLPRYPLVISFNPRARVGHDTTALDKTMTRELFQSTCPRGARPLIRQLNVALVSFQSTCPRGARPALPWACRMRIWFQSTCPRGARRLFGFGYAILEFGFNPRARVGHDHPETVPDLLHGSFNPRARVGHDFLDSNLCLSSSLFQSTCPRGARLEFWNQETSVFYVSIHVPAWGTTDCKPGSRSISIRVSIHVPAWGTTAANRRAYDPRNVSIHVPAWGTTPLATAPSAPQPVSIHVPAWGTT